MSEPTTPVRVMLVDDDPRVRTTLTSVLTTDPAIEVVCEAADGQQALHQARSRILDVVVLDIRMPVLDGLATLEALRRDRTTARVLILTSFGESDYVRAAIALEADGFLLKSDNPGDILRAVRGTATGETWLSPAVARMVTAELRQGLTAERDARRAQDRLATLSPRERAVVDLLAHGRTNAEIGQELHLSESTVKTYVSSAMNRLDARNRVELAWTTWTANQRNNS